MTTGTADTGTWQKSACILCECNCGIEVQVEGLSLAKIRGDKSHPESEGYTCEKALRLDHYQSRTIRLTSPLRRTPEGDYEEISWDVAISEIAAKLAAVRDQHGGDKIFYYGGGGQGNHLGGTYAKALQGALGIKYTSNALAQEKTGEMYVDGRLYGGHTTGDYEHAEVAVFVGKNPWQSHSFPRARPVLKEIARDPNRTLVVIDPRRSETAAMADIHLQVRPGTDAWCLAALGAVLVQEDLVNHAFLDAHTHGSEPVLAAYQGIDVSDFADRCGVGEDLIRETARRIGTAASVSTYEDLGIQQAPNSTLSSYLNKMLWILTGNFGKPGAMSLHSAFAAIAGSAGSGGGGGAKKQASPPGVLLDLPSYLPGFAAAALGNRLHPVFRKAANPPPRKPSTSQGRRTPVTGARIIAGLVPCNSIAEEILTDHPDRFRALIIESVNPAHSLADSDSFRKAMRAVDVSVVIDIAMTETAREADYVLPAASQYEKWECTFFNTEFPKNVFHLRKPLLEAQAGTLPEPEIHTRLIRELGVVDPAVIRRLRRAAERGRAQFALTFFVTMGANPKLMAIAPYLLREALSGLVPAGTESLWGVAHLCAMAHPDAVRRAGFTGAGFELGEQLFERVLEGEALVFTADDHENAWDYVKRPDRKFTLEIPELIERVESLADEPSSWTTEEFPFVLSAGERRAFTANTIIRDGSWRRRGAEGELRISAADAASLGVADGDSLRVVTAGGAANAVVEVSDMMQPGHVSLPNGLGIEGHGVAPNELTTLDNRDWLAGTPLHKYVPARLERVDADTIGAAAASLAE